MKNFISVLFFLVCTAAGSSAQVMFQKAFGGPGSDVSGFVKQTNDGGYIITGGSNSANLIKTDSTGNFLWKKTYSGIGLGSIRLTHDGGYIISAGSTSFGAGGVDGGLLRTDSNGNVLWARIFGDTADEYLSRFDTTSDGGYILVGSTNSSGAGNRDIILLKTDSVGNFMWARTYGGPLDDNGGNVLQTSNGFMIVGNSQDFTGNYRIYLLKTDNNGSLIWSKILGVGLNCYGGYLYRASGGGYIIFIVFDDHNYILKIDDNGTIQWGKTLFTGPYTTEALSMQVTSDGGFIITGKTYCPYGYANIYLAKTDSLGNMLWTKSIGDSTNYDACSYVEQTRDGGYILTGYTNSFGAGQEDMYFIKTDNAGNAGCYEVDCVTTVGPAGASTQLPVTSIATPSITETSLSLVVGSGGGIETPLCLSFVSTEEKSNKQNLMSVYPNPAKEKLWIHSGNSFNESCVLTILDITGRKVLEFKFQSEASAVDYPVNISHLSPGLYVVKIKGEKTEFTAKIIKQD